MLSQRQLCDVELLCNGGLSPLEGFLSKREYDSVVKDHRLTNGLLFGLPIVYDTHSDDINPGDKILLVQDKIDLPIATLEVMSNGAYFFVSFMKLHG